MSDTSGTNSHSADPVADDIDERNAESGDVAAGEQVLDEGKVSPNQDEVGDDDEGSTSTSEKREHAAEPRTDAAAAPIQPESS